MRSKFFYTYVLRCSDSKLYIGHTEDLRTRLNQHKRAAVEATAYRLPIQLALSGAASKLSRSALLAFQEEAVKCIARIKEASDDRPSRVDVIGEGALAWACARTGGVKRGEAAVFVPHEAVIHIARVNVISRDRPHSVDSLA